MNRPRVREISAGGVLVRRSQQRYEVCLILRDPHRRKAWSLPKGHLEAGEAASAAALREVREETGVSSEILAPLGTISYQFTNPGEASHPRRQAIVSKTVSFFLMRALREAPTHPDPEEVVEVRWVPLDEAIALVTYDSERQVLLKAKQVIDKSQLSLEP